jgi:menin
MLRAERPEALYPAAICALADLREVEAHDAVEAAIEAGDVEAAERRLRHAAGDALALFEEAVDIAGGGEAASCGGKPCAGWHWYPHSYIVGFLCRRTELLEKCATAFPGQAEAHRQSAVVAFRQALQWAASGADVLVKFKFHVADEQLFKDVGEGTLESLVDGLTLHSKLLLGGQPIDDATLLAMLLAFWDGICVLFAGRPKPGAWVALVLRAARLFTPEARALAAVISTARSMPMKQARLLWRALKPAVLRPLFESADVEEGGERGGGKRQRR